MTTAAKKTLRTFMLPDRSWEQLGEIAVHRDLYRRNADPQSGVNRSVAIAQLIDECWERTFHPELENDE